MGGLWEMQARRWVLVSLGLFSCKTDNNIVLCVVHSRLPLIPLPYGPYPFILLPSVRLTFPIPNNQADALIRLFNSSIANPVFAAIPFVQHMEQPPCTSGASQLA